MVCFAVKGHIDADGKLTVQVPGELRDLDVQAQVIVLPLEAGSRDGWEDYERLAGEIRMRWPNGPKTQNLIDEIRG